MSRREVVTGRRVAPAPAGARTSAALALLLALPGGAPTAGQIDSATYFSLRRGMSESEVLVRAGPPDMVTTPGDEVVTVDREAVRTRRDGTQTLSRVRRSQGVVIERWHYIPAPSEPDPWITIVSMRRGEVWEIERTKVFTRHRGDASPAGDEAGPVRERPPSDDDIRSERADRTLDAAERYAETRARLKKGADAGTDAGDAPPGPPPDGVRVYRAQEEGGSVYYGDRPPGSTVEIIDVPGESAGADAETR